MLFKEEDIIILDIVKLSVRSCLYNIYGRSLRRQCFVTISKFSTMRKYSTDLELNLQISLPEESIKVFSQKSFTKVIFNSAVAFRLPL